MNRIPQISFHTASIKRLFLIVEFLMTIILINTAIADSTGTIMGMVVDKRTNRAVLQATIKLKELNCRINLDTTYGLYEFWYIPSGTYTLMAEYLGNDCELAEKVTIKPGSRTWLDLELFSDSTGSIYLDFRHPWQPPSADTQVPVRLHTIKYEPAGTISGKVTDKKTKQGLMGANLYLKDTSKGASVNSSDGSYIIRDIPAGKYTLQVSLIGYQKLTIKDVMVNENEETNFDFELVSGWDNSYNYYLNISNGTIIGRACDSETGRKIDGVEITIVEIEKRAISDSANGIFKFDNIPVGYYTLSAVRKGYNCESKERIKVTALSTTYLDFRLKPDSAGIMGIVIEAPVPVINKDEIIVCPGPNYPPRYGTITGIVTDFQTGLPIPGAVVMVFKTSMGAIACPIFGTYTILDVPPGEYKLSAACIGYKVEHRECIPVITDSSTICDFALFPETIIIGDGYRPCTMPQITKDVNMVTHLEAEQIRACPRRTVDKLIAIWAQ
jgi:hypothetical protein